MRFYDFYEEIWPNLPQQQIAEKVLNRSLAEVKPEGTGIKLIGYAVSRPTRLIGLN